jgi:hypothetical protein
MIRTSAKLSQRFVQGKKNRHGTINASRHYDRDESTYSINEGYPLIRSSGCQVLHQRWRFRGDAFLSTTVGVPSRGTKSILVLQWWNTLRVSDRQQEVSGLGISMNKSTNDNPEGKTIDAKIDKLVL